MTTILPEKNDAKICPVYGLVLVGGKSTRMGKDKAWLKYSGTTQVESVATLLEPLVERTYLSVRTDQPLPAAVARIPKIEDRITDIGPMGGILSAMMTFPKVAWLVVACDLPFLDEQTIKELLAQRNPQKIATAYQSTSDGLPEPLCAIFEPKAMICLEDFRFRGYTCPRKVLINSAVEILQQFNRQALLNANHPDEYEQVVRKMSQGRGRAPEEHV